MELYIDTSSKCNKGAKECKYCLRQDDYSAGHLSSYRAGNKKPLSTDDIKQIIEKVEIYSINGIYGPLKKVNFSGGEPLTNSGRIIELAQYCNDKQLKARLFTNGDALIQDDSLLNQLYESGIYSIQIGVHEYMNVDTLFEVLDRKKKDNHLLFIDFIVNNETLKHMPEVMKHLSKTGISSLEKRRIYAKFFDMAPLSESDEVIALALKDAGAKNELDSLYYQFFHMSTDNIQLMDFYKMNSRPSLCSARDSLPVNNYGDAGFCLGCYGQDWFGNAKTDSIEKIVKIRETLFNIIGLYDRYLVPYRLAKKIAFEKHGINYDSWFRPYCSRILRDLFSSHKTIEELAHAFQGMHDELSRSEPEIELNGILRTSDFFMKIGSK